MKSHSRFLRPALGLLFSAPLLPAPHTFAQTTSWRIAGAGDFQTATNWDFGTPGSTTNAIVNNGTSGTESIVNLTNAGAAANLTLGAFDTFNIFAGGSLTLSGTSISNAGVLNVTGGSGQNSFLALGASTTLTGSGVLNLAYTGTGAGAGFIEQTTGGVTLTNQSTIAGQGTIGNSALSVVNAAHGTIDANVSGATLTINPTGGLANTGGLLEATNGGILSLSPSESFSGDAFIDNAGGTIKVDGAASAVQFAFAATIQGGTLTSSNGGSFAVATDNVIYLDGTTHGALTISTGSTFTGGPDTETILEGTFTNNGKMQFNGGNGENTFLNIRTNTTLQGPGTVTLGVAGTPGGQVLLEEDGNGVTLTNEQTIQGQGTIGNSALSVVNAAHGTIDANVSGATLTINPTGGLANTGGLLEATNGGILSLSPSESFSGDAFIDNAGGTIKVDGAASAVQFAFAATIQGGTLTSSNGGSFAVATDNVIYLDGTTHGALTISTGSTFTGGPDTETILEGTFTNNGKMQFNGGNGENTFLNIRTNTTLQGPGTVTLGVAGTPGGQVLLEEDGNGVTLTNEQTIQGQGTIGNSALSVVNAAHGTIDANVSGATLTINPTGGLANTGGLLEATNGGILSLSPSESFSGDAFIDNAGGTIKVDGAASAVQFAFAATIQGGTLTSSNGGSFAVATDNVIYLDGTTHGALTISTGSTFTGGPDTETILEGTFTNNGKMQFNGGNGENTFLNIRTNTTLQGPGTVTLGVAGTPGGQVLLEEDGNGVTLTNEQTIQGQGTIGNSALSVVNAAHGTIDANVSGATLTINPTGGLANTGGLLEATNGGDLEIDNTAVANTGGLIEVQAGSSIHLTNPTTVTGGKLGGTGTIEGDFINDATVFMGTDVTHSGILTEDGKFTQDSGGRLFESISDGSNGTLDVNGNADLGGLVDVDLLGGFTPTNGEEFDLINYSGTLSGAFAGITGSDASEWEIIDLPGSVDLRFGPAVVSSVPEPSAWIDLTFLVVLVLGYPLIRRKSQAR